MAERYIAIGVKKYPKIMERVKNVREFRLSCPSPDTNHYADKPTFPVRLRYYSEDRINPALALPKVSSQNRRYIPMEVIDADVIAGVNVFDTGHFSVSFWCIDIECSYGVDANSLWQIKERL